MTRLSNRQFPMLKMFADGAFISITVAQRYDQRPFRSMLVQKWIEYVPKRGFHITPLGEHAYLEFRTTSIDRKDPTSPLTKYFDPQMYGLNTPTPRRRPRTSKEDRAFYSDPNAVKGAHA